MSRISIILFHSTNCAIWAAKILRKENVPARVIPIPRELSADCGFCLSIYLDDAVKVRELLDRYGVEYDRIADETDHGMKSQ